MIGFHFSLVVDLGLGAVASNSSRHLRPGPGAHAVSGMSGADVGLLRRSSSMPLEPLRAGPLEPEREVQRQLHGAMYRGED